MLVAGYSFHIGYLTAFGVDLMLLPMDMSDNFGTAWFMGLSLIAELFSNLWLMLLVPLAMLVAVISLVFVFILLRKRIGVRWLLAEHDESNPGRTILGYESYRWKRVLNEMGLLFEKGFTGVLILYVVLFLLPLLVVIIPADHGSTLGAAQKAAFDAADHRCADSESPKLKCIQIEREGDSVYRGLFITGTARFVAIYDGAGIIVLERQPTDKIRVDGLQPTSLAKN